MFRIRADESKVAESDFILIYENTGMRDTTSFTPFQPILCQNHSIFSDWIRLCTVCPRSSDPFSIVGYYLKWVITSSTYSIPKAVTPLFVIQC